MFNQSYVSYEFYIDDDDCQLVLHITQKTSLLLFQCVVKRNVFSVYLKKPELSDGSRRWSGKWFQALGPAMEKARRLNLLQ